MTPQALDAALDHSQPQSSKPRPGGHKRPRIVSAPLRGHSFIRVDDRLMGSEVVAQLSDRHFRAWLAMLAYVARYRGEWEREDAFSATWARFATFGTSGRYVRVTRRQVARFVELGLLEAIEDEDGAWLRLVDWRDAREKAAT